MFDILYGNQNYPYEAQWEERNVPVTLDEAVTYEGAVPIHYRNVSNGSRREEIINGLKAIVYFKTIRTKESITFKPKDRIIINSKVYKIKEVNKVENDLYKNSRIIYKHFVDYETELVLE